MGMKKWGILGGGQLAGMMLEAAEKLGAPRPAVYGQAADEPAYARASRVIQGAWTNTEALRSLVSGTDVIVFENEFIDLPALREVSRGQPVEFCPPLDVFSRIQHKIDQKRWLKAKGFPTSPFDPFTGYDQYRKWASSNRRLHVLKWGSRGYDGKGILVVTDSTAPERIQKFFDDAASVESI